MGLPGAHAITAHPVLQPVVVPGRVPERSSLRVWLWPRGAALLHVSEPVQHRTAEGSTRTAAAGGHGRAGWQQIRNAGLP